MRCDWLCKWCGSGKRWDVIDYVNDVEVVRRWDVIDYVNDVEMVRRWDVIDYVNDVEVVRDEMWLIM